MKKRVTVLAALVILLAILADNTAAYDSGKTTAHNIITSGVVDITVVEQRRQGDTLVTDTRREIPVMPATEVSRVVTVHNAGAKSFIRARVEIIFKDAEGKKMELTAAQLSQLVTLNLNASDWIRKEGDDLWLYYKAAVDTSDSTEPLFTTVSFAGEAMGNEYQGSKLEMTVFAQAVQADHNESDVLAAVGWPG